MFAAGEEAGVVRFPGRLLLCPPLPGDFRSEEIDSSNGPIFDFHVVPLLVS